MSMIDPYVGQRIIWIGGITTCKLKNWDITAIFMAHSLYGGGSELTYNNNSDVSNTIRSSSEYKAVTAAWIQSYKSKGTRTFNGTIEFKNDCSIKDLYVAFQHVNLKGEIRDDGNLYAEIDDIYNFDQFRFFETMTAPNAANDYGKVLMDAGIIKGFNITVKTIEWAGKPIVSSGTGIDKFLNVAKQELAKGFTEYQGNNMTPYGAWYGLNGQPWCAMFVSWCANQSGIIGSIVPMYAYCPYGVNWYEGRGLYRRRSSGYAPKSGDVIMFQSGGVVSHTGIVTNYGSDIVTTIEGNSGDAVVSHQYNLGNTYIHGYGLSDGSASGSTVDSSTLLRLGSAGDAVRNLQTTLIAKGYTCGSYGSDGDFGQGTYNAVVQFQKDNGLSVDGIVGSATWNALLNNSEGSTNSTLLKMGSNGSSVKNLQTALIARGYNCGSTGADGDFGQGTYNAVIQFQIANGLSADGIVGPATWNALLNNTINDYPALLRMGSNSLDVKTLQNALIAHGYNCGSTGADGDFGQGTYNAVIQFQIANGLSADGIVGPATWNALSNSSSSNSTVLKIGSKGDLVRDLQIALIARGYSCGSAGADGDFGQDTYNAVVQFQKDHGLSADGIVGPATWNALNNTSASLLRLGSSGDDVKKLQNALISNGYSCGSAGADGDFGQGTYNAVVQFQNDHGLSADGIVGPATWNAF